MTIAEIIGLAQFIGSFERLESIRRVQDMVLKLELAHCKSPSLKQSIAELYHMQEQRALIKTASMDSSHHSPHIASSKANHKAQRAHFSLFLAMTRGHSHAYTHSIAMQDTSMKHYSAPFDLMLRRLARTQILSSKLYDNDRILRLELLQVGSYKHTHIMLQCEFSGKYTNVIILDARGIIIEALRHISPMQSCRPIKVGQPLLPMPANPRLQSAPSNSLASTAFTPFIDTSLTPPSLESMPLLLFECYVKEQKRALHALQHTLISKRKRALEHLRAIVAALPDEQELLKESKTLHHHATLLLAYIHTLKPYQTHVELIHDTRQYVLCLPLAPSPSKAIDMMFHQARRLANKARNIHKEAFHLQEKITFLANEIDFIMRANELGTLMMFSPSTSRKKRDNAHAFIVFIHGVKISIGRNEKENILLLESARANDMWLHVRDMPSAHLIIHCGKNAVAERILYKAGEVLLGVSGLKGGDFCVDYTRRKFVQMIQGARVVYSQHKSLYYRI